MVETNEIKIFGNVVKMRYPIIKSYKDLKKWLNAEGITITIGLLLISPLIVLVCLFKYIKIDTFFEIFGSIIITLAIGVVYYNLYRLLKYQDKIKNEIIKRWSKEQKLKNHK